MGFVLSAEKIKDIVKRRFSSLPASLKPSFPPVISRESLSWIPFGDNNFLGLIFIDNADQKRVQQFKERNLHPFPGLITTDVTIPSAFRLENSRNNIFSGCTVENTTSFSIRQDSSAIILEHSQILKNTDVGDISYKVQLGYIVSFGTEITSENIYEYLEDLIAYSIKQWRGTNG